LLWGEQDRVMPRRYAARIAAALGGPNEIRTIPGAGHLAELDRPDMVADAILSWVG
jgi:pimeloyl-ACP methyl ester carboxylesterase